MTSECYPGDDTQKAIADVIAGPWKRGSNTEVSISYELAYVYETVYYNIVGCSLSSDVLRSIPW